MKKHDLKREIDKLRKHVSTLRAKLAILRSSQPVFTPSIFNAPTACLHEYPNHQFGIHSTCIKCGVPMLYTLAKAISEDSTYNATTVSHPNIDLINNACGAV
jgi:hypothetical protein